MKHKVISGLIPLLLLLSFVPAYAEITEEGSDYQINSLGNNEYTWSSMPARIHDGNSWVNYIATNDLNSISFESKAISFSFDKASCNFKLYKDGQQVIDYTSVLSIDDIAKSTGCNIISLSQTETDYSFTSEHDGLETTYTLNYVSGLEWTYELTSKEGKDSILNIKETCKGCTVDLIDGDQIYFGDYIYDSKNEIHKTLKETQQVGDDYVIEFEKAIKDKETVIIDPTFSSVASAMGYSLDNNDSSTCTVGLSLRTDFLGSQLLYDTDHPTADCGRNYVEWTSLNSIPIGSEITSVHFKFQAIVSSSPHTDCSIYPMSSQPSVSSAATVFADAKDGTAYILTTNYAGCSTTGTNKDVNLGSGAVADVQTKVDSSIPWFAIGLTVGNEALDAVSGHSTEFARSGGTPNPTLEITYTLTYSPGPPTNPAASNDINNAINFTWTTNNATSVVGYAIWNSSTNSVNDWEWDNLANTGNFTGSQGYYLDSGLPTSFSMYYKASAFSANNGTNSTGVLGSTAGFGSSAMTQEVNNIGDGFRINGTINVPGSTYLNITQIVTRINGTIVNTNTTDHNQTAPYFVKFGPIWSQILVDGTRNITTTVSIQTTAGNTINNETKSYKEREYDPDYITAIDASQGLVNYTLPGNNILKVNRDTGGATFQIECNYLDQSDAFFNQTGAFWDNQSNIGYYNSTYPNNARYVICYNDAPLFSTILPTNYTTFLQPGLIIFDELGGFMGAPSALLMVLAIFSLATGRNFPVVLVIAMSVLGIMGSLALIVFSAEIWGLLMVLAGIGIFQIRKFF